MKYAQIDEKGICFAISNLSGEVKADDMILLTENEPSDRKSTRLNSSHNPLSRMPSSA